MQNSQLQAALVVVLVLGWVVYRQTRWQVLDQARIWRGPVLFAVLGVVAARDSLHDVGPVDLVAFAVQATLSLVVGALMGRLSQLRPVAGGLEARTGLAGSALWLLLIVVRVALDSGARAMGATAVTSVGVILLLLAVNRAGRIGVLVRRAEFRSGAAH
ncbi:hypothetical protein [Nocardia stercoris]|uniref:DUF1453 domain-containing protein n=1 Tax=Nocardia stercoris TaxID=2483361 RepID=A0A3M2L886_9NOCA|nr:hypothetical protein [Nocardia stercoris]RMI33236.1 hypothetical protein EBN03_08570 [Nocardia stercoris]